MSEPDWASYVGMATGVVGAITGIAGSVMGYISYRKTNSLKVLDLRLELSKAANTLVFDIGALEDQIATADKSRKAIASAIGASRSGQMEKWIYEVSADQAALTEMKKAAPEPNANFRALSEKELESRLVELHRLQIRADQLKEKYAAELARDEEGRKQIAAARSGRR